MNGPSTSGGLFPLPDPIRPIIDTPFGTINSHTREPSFFGSSIFQFGESTNNQTATTPCFGVTPRSQLLSFTHRKGSFSFILDQFVYVNMIQCQDSSLDILVEIGLKNGNSFSCCVTNEEGDRISKLLQSSLQKR